MQKRLQPLPPLDVAKATSLIAGLADERFAERERAAADLLKLDERIVPLLRDALDKGGSAEQRKRIAELLHVREGRYRLRQSRALRVLELIGTSAIPLLRELAQHPDAEFRADVEAALARVLRRTAS